jgi:hypothetical protein
MFTQTDSIGHAERIQGRHLTYLDTNVWIALAHESSEQSA